MSEEVKLSKDEHRKFNSRQLRGNIAEELKNDADHFEEDADKLLKFHGTYMQDDRDDRKAKNADGTKKGKSYIMMVRTRVPGGALTADQFLAELDLCEKYGNGTLRVTTRQGLQLHGVLKKNVKAAIKGINDTMLTTLAACGDVNRNVMACPAPVHDAVHQEIQALAFRLAQNFKPKTTGYYEIWLRDEHGQETNVTEFQPVEEPIYGDRYLPRKFKMAITLPEDNCVNVYANDFGLIMIREGDNILGYNVVVGGSMGRTPSAAKTFPAVAKPLCFVTPEQVIPVAEAVVKVQRDFGNREDRKVARMKYLVANWGIEKFRAKVEEYCGFSLTESKPVEVTDVDDHMGWHEQGNGKWFLGVNVECGRIKDEGELRVKSGLRKIVAKYRMPVRLTPLQGVLLCDIEESQRADIEAILAEHGVTPADHLTPVRRYSIACPAFPTCGLSITESERIMPHLIDQIEIELAKHGLLKEKMSIHMTGCPNGCARPYTPDIGFVGKSVGKYTIFLGGNVVGSRIGFIYKPPVFEEAVPQEDVVPVLAPLFAYYKAERRPGESFGDFCHRKGPEDINGRAQATMAGAAS
ncbi:MAG: NADPH-dependent assimilatory sulfite reductase hemoprotein subunit [Planctomycetaceae bacterium]|nr:NADPH-dependent assimilatory sulfite reductase hemoprotein subunit [Planctomycetaceae bacterium]